MEIDVRADDNMNALVEWHFFHVAEIRIKSSEIRNTYIISQDASYAPNLIIWFRISK